MKELDRAKKLYQKLRNDKNSILFGEDDLTNNFIKRLKKSNNEKDKEFVNSDLELKNKNYLFKGKDVAHIPTKTEFVK